MTFDFFYKLKFLFLIFSFSFLFSCEEKSSIVEDKSNTTNSDSDGGSSFSEISLNNNSSNINSKIKPYVKGDVPRIMTFEEDGSIVNNNSIDISSTVFANSDEDGNVTKRKEVFTKVPPVISGFSIKEDDKSYNFSISISGYGDIKKFLFPEYSIRSNIIFWYRVDSEFAWYFDRTFRINKAIDIPGLEEYWGKDGDTSDSSQPKYYVDFSSQLNRFVADVESKIISDSELYEGGPDLEVISIKFTIPKNNSFFNIGSNPVSFYARIDGLLTPVVGLSTAKVSEKITADYYSDFENSLPYNNPFFAEFNKIGVSNNSSKEFGYVSPTETFIYITSCPQSDAKEKEDCLSSYNSKTSLHPGVIFNLPDNYNLSISNCVGSDDDYFIIYGISTGLTCRDKRIEAANNVNPSISWQHSKFIDEREVELNFDLLTFAPFDTTNIKVIFYDELFQKVGEPVTIERSSMKRIGSGDTVYSFDDNFTEHRIRVNQKHTFGDDILNRLSPYIYIAVYVGNKEVQKNLKYGNYDFSDVYFVAQYGGMLPQNLDKDASLFQIDSFINGGSVRINNRHYIQNNLIFKYSFDDKSLLDESPNNNDAINIGDVEFTKDRFGNDDSALYFDGENEQYISSGKSLFNNIKTFTISGWVKYDSSFTANRTSFFGQNDSFEIGLSDRNTLHSWSATHSAVDVSSSKIKSGEWNHIVVVGSYGRINVYINGELEATRETNAKQTGGSSYYLNIGGAVFDAPNTTGINHFKGSIDDVVLYSTSLSPELVKELYDTSKAGGDSDSE